MSAPEDPRSTEWRDPDALPWWAHRPAPIEPPPPDSPPPGGPRRTRLIVALGTAVVLLIVLGIALAANRGSSRPAVAEVNPGPIAESALPNPGIVPDLPLDTPTPQASPTAPDAAPSAPTDDTDPVSVTKAYYADLAGNRTTAAFNLLCELRQQAMPLSAYTQAYADDVATGTGVKTFTQTGRQQEQGNQAAVPGTLVLADKESVPITVLLLMEGDSWRVCSSDLGGVLPNPGSSSDPGTGGVTT